MESSMIKCKYDSFAKHSLIINVNSQLELDIYVIIDGVKYNGGSNKILIDNFDASGKRIIFVASVKNKKNFSYRFFFHKRNSSGLFQWCKEVSTVEKEIILAKKNPMKIVINLDIGYCSNKNMYEIDDDYLTAKSANGTKASIHHFNTHKNLKLMKMINTIDYLLFTLKNIVWLFVGFYMALSAYKTRFIPTNGSIFDGDMVWIDIFIIGCVFTIFTIYSFAKMKKYKSKEIQLLSNL